MPVEARDLLQRDHVGISTSLLIGPRNPSGTLLCRQSWTNYCAPNLPQTALLRRLIRKSRKILELPVRSFNQPPHTLLWSFHFRPAVSQAFLVSGWAPGCA